MKKHIFPVCGTTLTVLGRETNRDSEVYVHEDHRSYSLVPQDLYDAFMIGEYINYRVYNDDPSNSNPGQVFYISLFGNAYQTLIDSENFLSEDDILIGGASAQNFSPMDGRGIQSGKNYSNDLLKIFSKVYEYLESKIGLEEIPHGAVWIFGYKSGIEGKELKLRTSFLVEGRPSSVDEVSIGSTGKWFTVMSLAPSPLGRPNWVILGSNNWY